MHELVLAHGPLEEVHDGDAPVGIEVEEHKVLRAEVALRGALRHRLRYLREVVPVDPLVRRLVEERRCFGVPEGVVSGVSSPEEFECIASDCIVVIFGSDEVEVPTPIEPDIDAARLAEEERFSMRRFDLT